MRYVHIHQTDLKVPVICMGGGPLCAEDDQERVFSLLDTYYELGGNFIDSANIYGKWLSSGINSCDENIGAWMKSRGLRDKIIVTSKGGHPHLESMAESRLSKTEVAADLDESLNALQCDTIDLYYLHRDDENVQVSTIINYLNDFVNEGKIRYFGVSNWRIKRIRAAQAYAEQTNQQAISFNQVMWSYPVFDMSKSTIPGLVWLDRPSKQYHIDTNLAVVAYQSQARGFFSKLAAKEEGLSSTLAEQFSSYENHNRYMRATKVAEDMGTNVNAVSLAYLFNQSFPSIAIIGSHTVAQVRDSIAAADLELTSKQVRYLDEG